MRNTIIISLVLLFVIGSFSDSYGQQRRRSKYGYKKSTNKKFSKYKGGRVGYSGVGNPKYESIGISLNANNYFGDIASSSSKFSTDYKFIPDGLGITYSKVLHPGVFLRGGFNWGNIKADDFEEANPLSGDNSSVGRWNRNYHFKNSIYELSLGFEVDMLPSTSGARGRFPINPYLFVGVAGFYHSPKALAPDTDQAGNPTGRGGEWIDLQSIGTEGQRIDSLRIKPYSKFQFALPLGLGLKVKLTKNLDLNIEFGFRYLFTDYLDDIGGQYTDLDAFGDDYLARALSERGAEQRAELAGKNRSNTAVIGTGSTNVRYDFANDPTWSGSGVYTHGNNYVAGSDRGNSSGKDFLVTTQIRLVYILDKRELSKGKFR